jgi:uncharacterized OsmC-like protein
MQHEHHLRLSLLENFAFEVDFDEPGIAPLRVDEPAPLGAGSGPGPAKLLGAAIANCLAASLLFCLRKSRIEVRDLRAEADVSIVRTDAGRLRIGAVAVRLTPVLAADDVEHAGRCLGLFEEYCTVTASLRGAFPISVQVLGLETPLRELVGVPAELTAS